MKFQTYIPDDVLKPYIKALVIQEAAEESVYKVLPDTSLVIGFQYKGTLSYIDGINETPLSTSGITGLLDEYRIFKTSGGIGSVLVFFKEGGAAHFFRQPIHELFRESISLDNFMLRSELLLLEEQLYEAPSDSVKIKVVERFLISRITVAEPDKMVLMALSLIHKNKGTITMKELAAQLHISQSPFEKRFRKVIGASPKKFAAIVRLKSAIQSHNKTTSVTGLSYDFGFYDSSHFIKEFKRFTGETPENYFSLEH